MADLILLQAEGELLQEGHEEGAPSKDVTIDVLLGNIKFNKAEETQHVVEEQLIMRHVDVLLPTVHLVQLLATIVVDEDTNQMFVLLWARTMLEPIFHLQLLLLVVMFPISSGGLLWQHQ
jgi:hypothetical protein